MEIENLKVGNWYKSKMGNYFKFKEFKNNYFYSSEEIFNKKWRGRGRWREVGWREVAMGVEWGGELTEASLSEIQQYLPDGHVDKINMEKEVLIQTNLSQSEACDSCKYHNNCDKAPYTKNEICPARNGQHYPKQENQIPEYVELLPNFDNKYTGKIFNIKKDLQPPGWGYKSWEWLIQDIHKKYFKPSTKSAYEAQFVKKELPKEDLLAEAKRRYPVGTIYRCPCNNINYTLDRIQPTTYTFVHRQFNININAGYGKGYLYYMGKWAEILSPSEKKAEIPWTVGGWVRLTKDFRYRGNDYKKGEYHQITAVNQSVNPSVVNFKYIDDLGNTLKVEAYTQFSTQTPECEWVGMSKPSWYEEQDRLVAEKIEKFDKEDEKLFREPDRKQDWTISIKKNKVTSVEVLPLQKPCLISTKKKKSKLIFN